MKTTNVEIERLRAEFLEEHRLFQLAFSRHGRSTLRLAEPLRMARARLLLAIDERKLGV